MQYLGWFDDSKKPIEAKIADAVAAHQARFGTPPNVVLVNDASGAPATCAGCAVRVERYIRPNNFGVGVER